GRVRTAAGRRSGPVVVRYAPRPRPPAVLAVESRGPQGGWIFPRSQIMTMPGTFVSPRAAVVRDTDRHGRGGDHRRGHAVVGVPTGSLDRTHRCAAGRCRPVAGVAVPEP